MIQVNFKVDELEDPELATWLTSFKGKKSKELSANIRQALRAFLSGRTVQEIAPAIGSGRPELIIETGEIRIEKKELSPDEMAAKLDSMF